MISTLYWMASVGMLAGVLFASGCDTESDPGGATDSFSRVHNFNVYRYDNGAPLLLEGVDRDGHLLTSTWMTPDGRVLLEADWGKAGGHTGFYFYLDSETGGIRRIEYYINGVIHGPVLTFENPLPASDIKYYQQGKEIDSWPVPRP